ncbi:TetR/AcrR family transcriptional regulator [Aquitalea denitrificans]|uniref:TetR/AcrR family transcriptional regulator n=1 Tax=Aquitalea denitrificans TaxID=519081 RepID=UPI00135978EE|nr:TetR family transcriptional regulator [Aquitalea denitrificans]
MKRETNPHPTRVLLLEHGLQHLRQYGLRQLTVRGICQQAEVNPGSFVYHFGNRQQFVSMLLELWYAPLYRQLQDSLQQQGEPLDRLSAMLLQLVAFARAEGGVISQLLLDAGSGEVAAVEFIRNLAPRHPQLLLQCLSEAQQAGQLCQAPPLHQLMYLMSALGFPVLLQQLSSGKHILPTLLEQGLASYALEPEHLQQRLHWALKGLSARELA